MPLLHWLTRDDDLRAHDRVPYRLLDELPEQSHGEGSQGLLVQGDNLDALKALLPFYAGRVKCIYIDPPYNTDKAFEHYDDSLEHAIWLGMIVPRLTLLRDFLGEDGSIWVSIDDNEGHYLKVVMDEVFGRRNFITSLTFKQSSVSGPKTINPGMVTVASYVLGYTKRKEAWRPKHVRRGRDRDSRYTQFVLGDMASNSRWRFSTVTREFCKLYGMNLNKLKEHLGDDYEEEIHRFVIKNRDRVIQRVRILDADAGEGGRIALQRSRETPGMVFSSARDDGALNYYIEGKQVAFYANKVTMVEGQLVTGEPISNIWDDILANNSHNEGEVSFDGGKKPEALVKRILELTTDPGDLVLDSFLGSGTTAAVAHKMNRRWIGVEMGKHARTHCAFRLRRVVEGEQSGISKEVGWKGGGGFRFCTLGRPVFAADGRVNENIRFADLARHIWFSETRQPLETDPDTPLLGLHDGRAVALLFNGILKDKTPQGGNVLTRPILALLRETLSTHAPEFHGELTVYGAANRLSGATLKNERITFRQTPYEIPARA